jgi:hypothetical protein
MRKSKHSPKVQRFSERRDLNPWSSDDVSRNSLFPEAYLDHILNPGGRLCAHTQRKRQRTLKSSLSYRTKVGAFLQEAGVLVVTPLKVEISPAQSPLFCFLDLSDFHVRLYTRHSGAGAGG